MPSPLDVVPEAYLEAIEPTHAAEEYAVGRYDGTIDVISPLSYTEAHQLMNTYAELDKAGVMNGEYYIAGPLNR